MKILYCIAQETHEFRGFLELNFYNECKMLRVAENITLPIRHYIV